MTSKTHRDFLAVIGNTHMTARGRYDKQWNRFYYSSYSEVVHQLLSDQKRGAILDVGCSHGSWLKFLRKEGFANVYGVELDQDRAALARSSGYDAVFACEAAVTPLPGESIDAAVSTDVFVHILRLEDKIRVLQHLEELLKPGGCLVVNHASAIAFFNSPSYRVEGYCSYISLDEFIHLVHQNTSLRVVDIRPGYFTWRNRTVPMAVRLMQLAMRLPAAPHGLRMLSTYYASRRGIGPDEADAFYLKLLK